MWLFVLLMVTVRFMFWLCLIMLAVAVFLLGLLLAAVGALLGPEKGAGWKEAAAVVMRAAGEVGRAGDRHSNWLFPNPPRRYRR